MIQSTLLPKTGKCDNCKEGNMPLEEVEVNGKKKMFCDECRDGKLIEEQENGN